MFEIIGKKKVKKKLVIKLENKLQNRETLSLLTNWVKFI